MTQLEEESQPVRSTFELLPVLIPYLIGFFLYLGIFSNFPIYLQITQRLSDVETVELWSIISGVALLIGAITRIPVGILSDKIGRIRAFLLAYSVYFVALFVVLLSSNNIIYVVAMALIRFGTNIVAMTGRGVVSTSHRDLGLKNGLLFSISGFGSFLGPLILGFVLDRYAPDTILVVSLGLLIFDLVLFYIIYHLVNRWLDSNEYTSDLDFAPVMSGFELDIPKLLRKEGVLQIQFLFLLAGIIYGLILAIYSIYGYNIVKLSPATIGLVTGLGSLAQTLTAPLVGRLYLYIKDEYMRIVMWCIFVIAALTAVFSPISKYLFFVTFFLANIAFSGYFTMEITNMRSLIEVEEFSFTFGLGSSLVILATSITGFISPYLYNIVPEANFYLALGVAVFGLIYVIASLSRYQDQRSKREALKS